MARFGRNLPSVMSHRFSEVPKANIPRSKFNRNHGYKTTFDEGYLIPVFLDEALPGDTFNLRMTALTRLATPLFPVMDNMYLDSFFFSVPIRLIWDNWERFNGAQTDPGDSTDYLVPTISTAGSGRSPLTIWDYFGLPTTDNFSEPLSPGNVSSLPFRAYNLIWNEWFRDQNIQDSLPVPRGDGPDVLGANFSLQRRGKRHDYFTSALPWPQKGPSVPLPLGDESPVNLVLSGPSTPPQLLVRQPGDPATGVVIGSSNFGEEGILATGTGVIGDDYAYLDPNGTYVADLSDATAATINQLRQAFQVQRMFERDARGGTRYTEIILSHFGVQSPDARLQRPEYLGGGSTPINITPIPATATADDVPQGNLAGVGMGVVNGHGFNKSFTEHCIVIGLVSVRADLTYQQGIDRMWSRRTRFDFYWPSLAHLGEQAILRKEIYATSNDEENDIVFGYQERFAEYRYKPSRITGAFRSSHPQSLDAWHLSQYFESPPVLGPTFIEERPPIERIISVPSEPHFLFDSYFNFTCARPMPVYSVPGLIDHF